MIGATSSQVGDHQADAVGIESERVGSRPWIPRRTASTGRGRPGTAPVLRPQGEAAGAGQPHRMENDHHGNVLAVRTCPTSRGACPSRNSWTEVAPRERLLPGSLEHRCHGHWGLGTPGSKNDGVGGVRLVEQATLDLLKAPLPRSCRASGNAIAIGPSTARAARRRSGMVRPVERFNGLRSAPPAHDDTVLHPRLTTECKRALHRSSRNRADSHADPEPEDPGPSLTRRSETPSTHNRRRRIFTKEGGGSPIRRCCPNPARE